MPLPDFAALFQEHRVPILAGGAGGAVLLGIRARKSRAKAPAAAGGPASGVATTAAYAGRGGVYDSTANDVYNSIEPQISSLADQLAQLSNNIGAAQPTYDTPRGDLIGSGYFTPGAIKTAGGTFSHVASQPEAAALKGSGGTLYYEPILGQFAPEPAAGVVGGTPLYSKAS